MKNAIFTSALFMFACFKLCAQKPAEEMAAAEKKFAAMAKEFTVRKAFITFLDSSCIGFNKGQQVNLFTHYHERKEDSAKLTWGPELAMAAASGEMGFTIGPWEFRKASLHEAPVAHGYFASIWKKDERNEWKVMFDMGIDYTAKHTGSDNIKVRTIHLPQSDASTNANYLSADKDFAGVFTRDKAKAIEAVITADTWINIQGHAPLKNAAAIKASLDIIPADIRFMQNGYFVSGSKDFIAVYGTAIKPDDTQQAFLRVWMRKNNEWKLLLMIIG